MTLYIMIVIIFDALLDPLGVKIERWYFLTISKYTYKKHDNVQSHEDVFCVPTELQKVEPNPNVNICVTITREGW